MDSNETLHDPVKAPAAVEAEEHQAEPVPVAVDVPVALGTDEPAPSAEPPAAPQSAGPDVAAMRTVLSSVVSRAELAGRQLDLQTLAAAVRDLADLLRLLLGR